jgi:hypothetical protein
MLTNDLNSASCGLHFRRIMEVYDVEPEPTPPAPKPWSEQPAFGLASLRPSFGPVTIPPKRRRQTLDDIDISGFKRVRIHNKQGRVRLHVFNKQLPPSGSKENAQDPLTGTDVSMTTNLMTSFGSGKGSFLGIGGSTAFPAPEISTIGSVPDSNSAYSNFGAQIWRKALSTGPATTGNIPPISEAPHWINGDLTGITMNTCV